MQLPVQITIRDIPPSETLTLHIKERVKKLEKFADNIMSCRVVLDVPQKHQHDGKTYNVRIDLTIPRDEIVVNKIRNKNVFIAIRDAFNAAERQLKSHETRKRGEIKNHIALTHGKVARLFPGDEYGFIESFDGGQTWHDRGPMGGASASAFVHFLFDSNTVLAV